MHAFDRRTDRRMDTDIPCIAEKWTRYPSCSVRVLSILVTLCYWYVKNNSKVKSHLINSVTVTGNSTHPIASSIKDACFTYNFEMNLWTAGQWTDPNSRSDFIWKVTSDTQPMKYSNWYPGDTSGVWNGTAKPCLMLWLDPSHTYTWNGMPCDTKMCFVCQLQA